MPAYIKHPSAMPWSHTPPDMIPAPDANPYAALGYRPTAPPGLGPRKDGDSTADRCSQIAMAMPPMYPQTGTYASRAPSVLPPPPGLGGFDMGRSSIPEMLHGHNGQSAATGHVGTGFYRNNYVSSGWLPCATRDRHEAERSIMAMLREDNVQATNSGNALSHYDAKSAAAGLPSPSTSAGNVAGRALLALVRGDNVPSTAVKQPPPKEEKPAGGVSAKLDYDMDCMTDFVVDKAVELYGTLVAGQPEDPGFRKWLHPVLCATRLPSSTLLLSLAYLFKRKEQQRELAQLPGMSLHRALLVAMILASKFLDDNTFINRSWSEVSSIPVAELNQLEKSWLEACAYRLHDDAHVPGGFMHFHALWLYHESTWMKAKDVAAARRVHHFTAAETAQRHYRGDTNKPLPSLPSIHTTLYAGPPSYQAKPAMNGYTQGAPYPRYDVFLPLALDNDNSPPSAATTGPTTPDYYHYPSNNWQNDGYRQTMFMHPPGLPPPGLPPRPRQSQQMHPPPQYSQYSQYSQYPQAQQNVAACVTNPAFGRYHNPDPWNHGSECICFSCAQRLQAAYAQSGLGRSLAA